MELAILLPIVLLLVFGVIEFGTVYNDYISLRQGTREAARQGAVANFGTSFSTGSPCHLTLASGSTPSDDIKKLMCSAKREVGLKGTNVRVKVLFANPGFTTASTSWTMGDGLIVCTQSAIDTATGLFDPFIGGKMLRTKTAIRIEQPTAATETSGSESPPSGGDWAWCTVSSSSP